MLSLYVSGLFWGASDVNKSPPVSFLLSLIFYLFLCLYFVHVYILLVLPYSSFLNNAACFLFLKPECLILSISYVFGCYETLKPSSHLIFWEFFFLLFFVITMIYYFRHFGLCLFSMVIRLDTLYIQSFIYTVSPSKF